MVMDYADLMIGAYGYPNASGKGRSYVVFGGPGVWEAVEIFHYPV